MDALERGYRLFGRIDVAQAHSVQFEDRSKERGDEKHRQHDLDKGEAGLAGGFCSEFHYPIVLYLITVFMELAALIPPDGTGCYLANRRFPPPKVLQF